MLTSITPLGERGRGQRWVITAAWLMLGHLVGGIALGALLAGAGWSLRALVGPPSDALSAIVIGIVVLTGAIFDLSGRHLPGRRQVDERWLNHYRGWVYGVGFGLQLGFGLVTVVNTALVIAVLAAGILVSASEAVVIGLVYGATRGIAATANGWVRSVGDLHRLSRWLDRRELRIRWTAASIGTAAAVCAVVIA